MHVFIQQIFIEYPSMLGIISEYGGQQVDE